MADGKQSFILYRDIIHTVKLLPRSKRGDLFMIILEYVNDLDPQVNDSAVALAFEPIKQKLKADLKKWENKRETNRENGKKGGRPKTQKNPKKPNGFKNNRTKAKKGDSVSVTVSDTVSVDSKESLSTDVDTPLTPQGELRYPFESDNFFKAWELWKRYRKEMRKPKYHVIGEQAALSKLGNMAGGNEGYAIKVIEQSIANGWTGLFELDERKSAKKPGVWAHRKKQVEQLNREINGN